MRLRSLLAVLGLSAMAATLDATTAMAQTPGRGRSDVDLKAGDKAPDFKLKSLDGNEHVLSSNVGKKPVALIFGSCT